MLSFFQRNSGIFPNGAPVNPAKAPDMTTKKTEATPREYFSANGMLFTVVPAGTPTAVWEAPVVDREDAIRMGIRLHR